MRLLLGGSPCTHWSIAQTKKRETEPQGLGWELFKNYLIALEKFKPDFFLYENNKSMAPAIREQITRELGVEPILINSALVSAQNRQRLYWTNIPGVEQPEDLGILLRDILESGLPLKEKGYTLKANYANAGAVNGVCGQHFPAPMAAEPVRIGTIESDAKNADFDSQQYRVYSPDGKSVTLCGQGGGVGAKTGLYAAPICINQLASGKSRTVDAHMGKLEKNLVPRINDPNPAKQQYDCIIQPIRVGDMPNASGKVSGSQSGRIYSVDGKGVPLQARPNGGGADGAATGLYAVPAGMAWRGRGESSSYEMRDDQKANSVTAAGHQSRLVIEAADGKTYPIYEVQGGQITIKGKQYPIKLADGFYIIRYSVDGKGVPLQARPNGGGADGAATGLYAVPAGMAWRGLGDSSAYEVRDDQKANSVTAAGHHSRLVIEAADGKTYPIYEVQGGQITIKGKQYPIKLADGFYIIRKLTVTECKRLQTVPEEYIFPVSDTQAYKMLGNGWTVDVIAHILSYCPGITTEPLEVLSMYDGMSCGHLALNKLGAHIAHYYATEIDKYAIQTTQHNFPETIQLGDAFQVRDDGWSLPGLAMEETVATLEEAVEENMDTLEEAVEEPEPGGDHVAAPSIITERKRNCVLSLSYGKDSLACLGAIEELGWPLDRIIHAEVWATDTIPADLPPMMEFKAKADAIIRGRWGIEVEHIRGNRTYEECFYLVCGGNGLQSKSKCAGEIYGWPFQRGPWCNSRLKQHVFQKAMKNSIQYIGIAADEPGRFHNLDDTKKSPLVEAGWTEAMCREWCEKNGLLSPIYTSAARGGCWFCHNQGIQQLRLLRKNHPEYWEIMLKWDKDSPVPFRTDGHTVNDFERRFQLEDQGLISPDDRVFRWSMLEEPLNFRLF